MPPVSSVSRTCPVRVLKIRHEKGTFVTRGLPRFAILLLLSRGLSPPGAKERTKAMARTRRIKKTAAGVAYYHLMSRTNDRKFLFDRGEAKTRLVDALKRAAAFSGIEIDAYVAMDNHFHVVCKVVRPEEPVPEAELIRRVAALRGERAAEELASHWRELREIGMESAVAEAQERLRARMNDINEFMKTFKETFNVWYKRERKYTGSIWSGRFTSTLVEGGRYRAVCMRYVYFNPVRAGVVTRADAYAWSWIAAIDEPFAGPVPAEWLMRRVAQIGGGKVFGSEAFVVATAFALGDRFRSRSVSARAVGELGFATHGWKLAKEAAA